MGVPVGCCLGLAAVALFHDGECHTHPKAEACEDHATAPMAFVRWDKFLSFHATAMIGGNIGHNG